LQRSKLLPTHRFAPGVHIGSSFGDIVTFFVSSGTQFDPSHRNAENRIFTFASGILKVPDAVTSPSGDKSSISKQIVPTFDPYACAAIHPSASPQFSAVTLTETEDPTVTVLSLDGE